MLLQLPMSYLSLYSIDGVLSFAAMSTLGLNKNLIPTPNPCPTYKAKQVMVFIWNGVYMKWRKRLLDIAITGMQIRRKLAFT